MRSVWCGKRNLRGYDEIGKHDGLKIRCSVELVGSNPIIPIQVAMPIPKKYTRLYTSCIEPLNVKRLGLHNE